MGIPKLNVFRARRGGEEKKSVDVRFGEQAGHNMDPLRLLLDFDQWGYLKNNVYRKKPTTAEDMKERMISRMS
ncbi:hypothetical protein M0804_009070 [Polistes exclamans]|nr:hypothetical protein M0804_009070 [Polistes exclamans]